MEPYLTEVSYLMSKNGNAAGKEQGKLRGWEGVKSVYIWLVSWCKTKRRTIFICGAMLFVVAGGLATRRLILTNAPPPLCSFHSSISKEIQSKSKEIQMDEIQRNNEIASTSTTLQQIKAFISDEDRINLENVLESEGTGGWSKIIDKQEPTFEYKLLGRTPKGGGPKQYLSTTRYRFYSDTTQIKNFMIDNDYKLECGILYKSFKILEVDKNNGIEYWHAIKQYPIIGCREYVLATKFWQRGEADKIYLCVTKAFDHPKAPKPQYPVIKSHLSGWEISKAIKGGCEMKMFYQEDIQSTLADLVKDSSKDAILNHVREDEKRLQEYIKQNRQPKNEKNAMTLAQTL